MGNIHAMTDKSHDGILLESHTLPLIGVTTGLLIAFSHLISSSIMAGDHRTTYYAEIIGATIVLALILAVDHFITKSKRKQRHETISLVHKKVMQILWAIIGVAVLLSIFMFTNFGPSQLTLWFLVLVFGLCLYIIGLFSTSWYALNGIIIISLSIITLVFIPPGTTLRLLTASLLIWGGVLIQYFQSFATTTIKKSYYSAIWISLALTSGFIANYGHAAYTRPAATTPQLSLTQLQNAPITEKYIVSLPRNTEITINAKLSIDAFAEPYLHSFKAKLNKNLDIELINNQATGTFRIDKNKWLTTKDAPFVAQYERFNTLTPVYGPVIKRRHVLQINSDSLIP